MTKPANEKTAVVSAPPTAEVQSSFSAKAKEADNY
jgi:hypothetical protein